MSDLFGSLSNNNEAVNLSLDGDQFSINNFNVLQYCNFGCEIVYCIFQCISRPFKSWKSLQKIDLSLYTDQNSMVAQRVEKITLHWHNNRLQSEAQKGNYAISLSKWYSIE